MKTKNSNNSPRDSTQGLIRYCNYTIEFPDGEIWSDYTHIAGGLESWITRTALHKMNPDSAIKLMRNGEYAWYVSHGKMGRVRHRMVISETACERKWGSPGSKRRAEADAAEQERLIRTALKVVK